MWSSTSNHIWVLYILSLVTYVLCFSISSVLNSCFPVVWYIVVLKYCCIVVNHYILFYLSCHILAFHTLKITYLSLLIIWSWISCYYVHFLRLIEFISTSFWIKMGLGFYTVFFLVLWSSWMLILFILMVKRLVFKTLWCMFHILAKRHKFFIRGVFWFVCF